uniref:NADH-ubiquinone oxidoreductase chain 3 n=1 Tax=Acropyga smithii TaxID=602228 RepID=A0A6G5NIL3_9HYME|nr:NADH dehydrogenase subunit 3 [Acropyga smithii]QBG38709.1 NADH dehydrogenase subunit 3 [Acropyga smithii]
MSMLFLIIMFILLPTLITLSNFLFSTKYNKMREKMSPFECGFDPLINPRLPFSIQFFLISLIFLIFDIEITILIPLIYMHFPNKIIIFTSFLFVFMLMFGLLIEYIEQSIDWKN